MEFEHQKTMKRILPLLVVLLSFGGTLMAQVDGFEQSPNKLLYRIWSQGAGKKDTKVGDFATVRIQYRTDQDSILSDWRELKVEVLEPDYKGHLMEGYSLLKKGDSATFAIPSNVFFPREIGKNRPKDIPSKSYVFLNVVMLDVKTKLEMMMGNQEVLDKANAKDQIAIKAYLEEKGETGTPDANGITRIELLAGQGAGIIEGCTIKVQYTGKLLDGRVFDSSPSGAPFRYVVGKGEVIPGWDKGLIGAQKGGRYLLALPSGMAYGKRGAPGSIIGSYTPLIFIIEVVGARFP